MFRSEEPPQNSRDDQADNKIADPDVHPIKSLCGYVHTEYGGDQRPMKNSYKNIPDFYGPTLLFHHQQSPCQLAFPVRGCLLLSCPGGF